MSDQNTTYSNNAYTNVASKMKRKKKQTTKIKIAN